MRKRKKEKGIIYAFKEEEEFNIWAREAAQIIVEKESPIVYVNVKELKPVRSRIEKLELQFTS